MACLFVWYVVIFILKCSVFVLFYSILERFDEWQVFVQKVPSESNGLNLVTGTFVSINFLIQCGTLFLTSKTSKASKLSDCWSVLWIGFPSPVNSLQFYRRLVKCIFGVGFCEGVLSGVFGSGSEIVILLSWIRIQVRQLNKLGIKGN